jgi:hypothetical protein
MLVTLTVRAGTVIASAGMTYVDPFMQYQALLPGQSMQGVEGAACELRPSADRVPSNLHKFCAVFPTQGPFHLINVTVQRGVIVEAQFFSESLQLGDLLYQWDEPHFTRRAVSGHTITLLWQNADLSAAATLPLRSLPAHVRVVTLSLNG